MYEWLETCQCFNEISDQPALTQMETKIMPHIFSTYLMGFFDFKIQDFKIH